MGRQDVTTENKQHTFFQCGCNFFFLVGLSIVTAHTATLICQVVIIWIIYIGLRTVVKVEYQQDLVLGKVISWPDFDHWAWLKSADPIGMLCDADVHYDPW